jgi:hypothetical protein
MKDLLDATWSFDRAALNKRPIRMKIPAAMARIPIIMGRPEKLKLNKAISPYRMSQMANNRKPKFLVIFMLILLLT